MRGVRRFEERDIPQIIALNPKSFPGSRSLGEEELRWRLSEICFRNPWYDDRISSLVYEGKDGEIIGFIGVVPRSMILDGRQVTLAVSQHLMVDPSGRSSLAAFELIRKVLSGPQDITVADMSTDLSRRLWERLGGKTSLLYSLLWRKPLRPFSFGVNLLRNKTPVKYAAPLFRPLASAADAIAIRTMNRRNHNGNGITTETLTAEKLTTLIQEFYDSYSLRPSYSPESAAWLFRIEEREKRWGTFQHVLVKDAQDTPLGWFIYHLNRRGQCQVLQIGARENTIATVLDEFFDQARAQGGIELSGRVQPRFMDTFTRKRCLFLPGRSWVLVSSRLPGALQSFAEGKAFFSRMEGDLWFF